MENALYSNNLNAIKKLVRNGASVNGNTNNGISYIHYALFYKLDNIAQFLRNAGAKLNQSNLNDVLSQHIDAMEEDFFMYNDTENKPNFIVQKFKRDIAHLKFLIKFGASTKQWMNYDKYARTFPNSAKSIKKVHNAIVTATAQQKKKKDALQKMKAATKKQKARVLLLNKSSVKGFKNLPLNVQKRIMTMV